MLTPKMARVIQKKERPRNDDDSRSSQTAPSILQRSGGNSATSTAKTGGGATDHGGGRHVSNGLPPALRAQMEAALGHDFSGVRIHTGSKAAEVGAVAYTQGTDIHFAPGAYDPGSISGRQLLGHELTHVVQQAQGRVSATTQAKGMGVNDDVGLEREADVLGAKAAQHTLTNSVAHTVSPMVSTTKAVVQRYGGNTPAPGVVPTPITSIDDFIRIVERVEAAYPGEDWRQITTRIRKSYYDGGNWNEMIADRQSIDRVSARGPLTAEDIAALTRSHAVIPVNGQSLDVGHLLTGLDAQNFPRTGGLIGLSGIHGPSGATWAGDVGSALAEFGFETQSGLTTREEYYNNFASEADMLGDVDGIAISGVTLPPGAADTLSARLRAYYGAGSTAARPSDTRFTAFCTAAGFTFTGRGSAARLDAAARATIRSRISDFATMWALKLRREHTIVFDAAYTDADLTWFADHFITWVESGLARENP